MPRARSITRDLRVRARGAVRGRDANRAKVTSAAMSHDWYAAQRSVDTRELPALGIRPVNEQQQEDLWRIARNQAHLLASSTTYSISRGSRRGMSISRWKGCRRDHGRRAVHGATDLARRLLFSAPCDQSLTMLADRTRRSRCCSTCSSTQRSSPILAARSEVCATGDDDTVRISVSDTGVGILPDRLDAIRALFRSIAAQTPDRRHASGCRSVVTSRARWAAISA